MKTIIAAAGLVLACITTYGYGCEEWMCPTLNSHLSTASYVPNGLSVVM